MTRVAHRRLVWGLAPALALAPALPSATAAALPLHPRRSPAPAPAPALALARLAEPPATSETEPVLSRGEGPMSSADRARRNTVVEDLLDAEALATESPQTAVPVLQAALRAMADVAPLVAHDDYAQQARVYAQLALARTHLVLDHHAEASESIDSALRIARGKPLPAAQFGPSLVALYDERVAAAAKVPPGVLEVRCTMPCRVLVDEQAFEGSAELPAGPHRVWIEAVAPGIPVMRREIVTKPGERMELSFEAEGRPEPEPEPDPYPPDGPLPAKRILPRWASAIGLGLGVAAVGTGGALVGVDHRCPDLRDPREVPCLWILNTDAGGFALIGIGSAVAITAAVILAVDEVRAKRAKRRGAAPTTGETAASMPAPRRAVPSTAHRR
ncbi:hypothetical protein [Paraliomyxa miuraensis]|uniref:hypothetical protein n=1 Tax=Paraliomyxa miuraensis TaxID=376150 RepID=UPI002256D8C3|nr:hypothetical protein [Paraliomyxa miuraensis]MCX4245717.1 hypothetical protein [Paraliomyxa miuraensis]